MSDQTDDLVRRGQEIYDQRLKALLEPAHVNEFLAIEPDSGDYFLGKTLTEAITAARRAYPDRISYALRIGHPAAVHIGSWQ